MVSSKEQVNIRALAAADIAELAPILRHYVVDRQSGAVLEQEVQAIIRFMAGTPDEYGRLRDYIVACTLQDKVIGCAALGKPDPLISAHCKVTAGEAFELLNIFVHPDFVRGKGVGSALFAAVCAEAQRQGGKMLVLNSGLRHEQSWPFYNKVCDQCLGLILNRYGPGRHANTWVKRL